MTFFSNPGRPVPYPLIAKVCFFATFFLKSNGKENGLKVDEEDTSIQLILQESKSEQNITISNYYTEFLGER